jgi:hypothetical protein
MKLRGEVVGVLNIKADGNRKWSEDDIDIINAIMDRAALSVENARLLSESRRLVVKERTIGEITAKISAQSDINDLLKIAAQELNRTLQGTEVVVQLQSRRDEGT